jgi:hypothetical protein
MTGRKRFLDAAASPPEAPLPVPAVLTAATLGIDERGTRRSAPRPGITDSSPAIARARDALRGIGPGADHFDTPQHENEPQRGEKTLHAVAGCRPAQKAVAGERCHSPVTCRRDSSMTAAAMAKANPDAMPQTHVGVPGLGRPSAGRQTAVAAPGQQVDASGEEHG